MSERRIGRAILDALTGVPLFITAAVIRRWDTRWEATEAEVSGRCPGTRSAQCVIQRGASDHDRGTDGDSVAVDGTDGYRRAGFYTYVLLDNAGYGSADRILSAYQDRKVGDWMWMSKGSARPTAFKVKAFEPSRWLLSESPTARDHGSSSRWTGIGPA